MWVPWNIPVRASHLLWRYVCKTFKKGHGNPSIGGNNAPTVHVPNNSTVDSIKTFSIVCGHESVSVFRFPLIILSVIVCVTHAEDKLNYSPSVSRRNHDTLNYTLYCYDDTMESWQLICEVFLCHWTCHTWRVWSFKCVMHCCQMQLKGNKNGIQIQIQPNIVSAHMWFILYDVVWFIWVTDFVRVKSNYVE